MSQTAPIMTRVIRIAIFVLLNTMPKKRIIAEQKIQMSFPQRKPVDAKIQRGIFLDNGKTLINPTI